MIMNRLTVNIAIVLSSVLLFMGCGKAPVQAEEIHKDKLAFNQNELIVFVDETIDLPVSFQKWERGVYVKSQYDFAANPQGVTVISSAPGVAEVTSDGRIRGVSKGEAVISMASDKVSVSGKLAVTVDKLEDHGTRFTQDLTQPLSGDMIILPSGFTRSLQSFDIDKRGVVYTSNETDTDMRVRAFGRDGKPIGTEMVLPSGGHGDGFSIEYDGSDVYFWTSGTMGEHMDNGGYSGGRANASDVRLICRHLFQAGATQYAEDAVECFYLNDNGCRIVDVDTEHDVMACWTYEEGSDYIYVFKFSDIRTASKVTKTVTRESHNTGKAVSAYDLNTVKPMARFSWKRKGVATGDTNSGAVQGFCVYDDRIYVESGAKNDEATLISVLDFQGHIEKQLVKLGVTVDKQKLVDVKISGDGALEPEGMHIHNGVMYLGFVGDFPGTGSTKRACIVKLK